MKIIRTLLLGAAITTFGTAQGAEVERIEPPFWWAGMQANTLQLMVYGDDIGSTDSVVIDSAGVSVTQLHTADSPNYLFVDLKLDDSLTAKPVTLKFYADQQQVADAQYSFKARHVNSAQRKGFSAQDVIYLITPDRFANGDLNNDEVKGLREGIDRQAPGGRHGGDIAGVIQHLDYLADMGFTQLWLNPVLENAQAEYSYHGYSTTDFYRVDPRMGSNKLYVSLSDQAADKGMGLIKDIILNHCGSGHWWMDDLPFTDWINYNASFSPTSHRRESLRDPHAAEVDKQEFNDGWFVPTMPDLNQRNRFMARYLIQNSIWWVEYAGLSGIRVDTYSYPDKTFLTGWSRAVMAEYPNLNIVGEEWSENSAIVAYWQEGKKTFDGYQSFTPSMMDFPWQRALLNSLNNEESWGEGMVQMYQALSNDFLYADPYNLVIFPDNHDMSRIYTSLNENYEHWKMAMIMTLTLRGIPQIYYGTEILMTNPGTDDHGVIRTDFPGGWPGDRVNAFNAEGLTEQQAKAQEFLKFWLNWRKTSTAVTQGKLMHYAPRDSVYVYFRYTDSDTVMVVINHSDSPQSVDPQIFEQRLAGFTKAHHVESEQITTLSQALQSRAQSVSVYELQ
ncbi:glycoside hydrolase family 13 protein [Gilvimarinus xylanilyticus]|uniref:Glycoside hydrolase family 13 protein n=1 Tax=Gilvimarinus xylanilyticus TaxID=2944139 RepID=A0A9X2I4X1_9GAMM|nr:glycoside hydrolase family 13 protein [Gilvimarinus xylanilyticus]MCP8900410.1 glycoside hydrolase family 13 protein [Gilvimarinus xylanilyticus]